MDNLTLEDVKEIARRDFASYPLKRILEILDEYGRVASEKEMVRVYIAILKLSCYDINRLKKYVDEAKKDYKQVLFWAE